MVRRKRNDEATSTSASKKEEQTRAYLKEQAEKQNAGQQEELQELANARKYGEAVKDLKLKQNSIGSANMSAPTIEAPKIANRQLSDEEQQEANESGVVSTELKEAKGEVNPMQPTVTGDVKRTLENEAQEAAERDTLTRGSWETKAPFNTAEEAVNKANTLAGDEPFYHAFLKTHPRPTPPSDYDQKRENALRWMQGFQLLGKAAGIISDVGNVAKRNGVVLKKEDHQGKAEVDAIEKNITALKEQYAANTKMYQDAERLYRKAKQEAIDKDIEANNRMRELYAKQQKKESFSMGDGNVLKEIAALRNYRSGAGSNMKGMIPLTVNGKLIAYHKDAQKNVVSLVNKYVMQDWGESEEGSPERNKLLRYLSKVYAVPISKSLDINTAEGQREFLNTLFNKTHIGTAQDLLQRSIFMDTEKGVVSPLTMLYLEETKNPKLLNELEDIYNMYNDFKPKGWLLGDESSYVDKRNALVEYFTKHGMAYDDYGNITNDPIKINEILNRYADQDYIETKYYDLQSKGMIPRHNIEGPVGASVYPNDKKASETNSANTANTQATQANTQAQNTPKKSTPAAVKNDDERVSKWSGNAPVEAAYTFDESKKADQIPSVYASGKNSSRGMLKNLKADYDKANYSDRATAWKWFVPAYLKRFSVGARKDNISYDEIAYAFDLITTGKNI